MQISNEITMITNLTLEILIMLVTISFLMIDCARKKTESKLSSSKAQVEPPKPVVPQQNNPVMTTDVLVERKSQVGNIPPVPPPRPESVPQQTEQNVEIEKKVSDANTRLASEEKKSKKKAKSVKKLAKQPSKIFKKRKRILAKDCPPMEKTQRLMSSPADHRYAHRAFFEDHHVTNPNKIKYCGNIDVMKSNQKEFLDGIEEACKEYPKRAAEDKKRAAQKQKAPPTEVSQRGGKSVMESHVKVKSGRCLLFEMKPEDEVEVEKPDKKGK